MSAPITCPHFLFDLDGMLIGDRDAVTACFTKMLRHIVGSVAELASALDVTMVPAR